MPVDKQHTVFVVDDDEGARKSVCALVESMGLHAEAFASAEEFLDRYAAGGPGCLVSDLRMTGMNGLELQERLRQRHIELPVIVLTAFARTPVTVRALQSGAITVLDKPYNDDDLWNAIRAALAKDAADRDESQRQQRICERFAQLTSMEQQVVNLIISGQTNKAIAQQFGISLRTVAIRRATIMAKTGANSTAELIRLAIACKVDAPSQ
jgi:two-component system, LuxR family, response regulator FixJ